MNPEADGLGTEDDGKVHHDLILTNGQYHVNVAPGRTKQLLAVTGQNIRHALPIRGRFALPWLGKLYRNSWAKRKGALLLAPASNSSALGTGR